MRKQYSITVCLVFLLLCGCGERDNTYSLEIKHAPAIEEELGALAIEGQEISLPCLYSDFPAVQIKEERILAPSQDEKHDGYMYQYIPFSISENAEYGMYVYFPKNESYEAGTVHAVTAEGEGASIEYDAQQYICGKTTPDETEMRLGTQHSGTEYSWIYEYQNGKINVLFDPENKTMRLMLIKTTESSD